MPNENMVLLLINTLSESYKCRLSEINVHFEFPKKEKLVNLAGNAISIYSLSQMSLHFELTIKKDLKVFIFNLSQKKEENS